MFSMLKIIEKIKIYDLFNHLLPGALFVIFADRITGYSLYQENIILGFFLYYFIGMIISRLGSLFVEPMLKKIGFLKYAEYSSFVAAAKQDGHMKTLSDQNNQYRTMTTLFMTIGIVKIWEIFFNNRLSSAEEILLLCAMLSILFLHSYKKQTNYILERVKVYEEKK